MNRDQALRQVTLASYGTMFLRAELELDKWYRHGLFAGTTMANTAKSSVWTARFGWALAFVVMSIFALACANIIVAWPWLAPLIGLTVMLAAKGKFNSQSRRKD